MSGARNGARNGAVVSGARNGARNGAVVSGARNGARNGAVVSGAGNGARNGAVGSGAMTSFPVPADAGSPSAFVAVAKVPLSLLPPLFYGALKKGNITKIRPPLASVPYFAMTFCLG